MAQCPSVETLYRLDRDSHAVPALAAYEAHVQACLACQRVLESLAREGPDSSGSLRSSVPEQDQPPEIPGFEFERELGRGGMGVVYRARQPALARHVALKVVRSGPGAGSHERRLWLREARLACRVRHPHVVQL
jgi:serine/threonine protein kinase